ncbi:MAG: histidine kinase [Ilumatobacteraceae bacterium]|nr:histidine kinase [Ilumatobacteraceae bacterium]
MSDLPPPPSPAAPPPDSGGSGDGFDFDWDRAKDLAERWFRPLTEREGWMALVYLFAGALVSPFLFGFMMAAAALTFGLSFVVVGLLLIVPTFLLIEVFVKLERSLAALAGHRIEMRPTATLEGSRITAPLRALTDEVRWRQAGFIAANVVIAPVLFAFGSFPFSFVTQVLFGDVLVFGLDFGIGSDLGVGTTGILALPLAAFFAGAIPRVAIWMAGIKAQIAGWFVGTDRLALAEERVSLLSSQRSDILDAVASERRRIERNLHDGVQQQLVAIGLDLGMAEQQIEQHPDRAKELIGNARSKVQGSIGELRQLGRGLHPAILEDRGIDAALSAVVSGSSIPISVQVDPDLDLSTDVGETVYFVANEAIANVLKHAQARVASVHVAKVAANVRVTIHDDGIGGVDASRGTGIAGIRARVNAVDGSLTITSPSGGPTTLIAEIPRT